VSESTLCKLSVCSSGSSYNELRLILNIIEKEILTHVNGIQELLKAVVPFDVLLDRKQRNWGLGAPARQGDGPMKKKTKVVRDAEVALAALAACEEALDRELLIATS
jgi:hypothetical protein